VNVLKGRCLGKSLGRIEMKKDKEIKRAVENHMGKDDRIRDKNEGT
jgi:hypothetical protein